MMILLGKQEDSDIFIMGSFSKQCYYYCSLLIYWIYLISILISILKWYEYIAHSVNIFILFIMFLSNVNII